MGMTGEPADMLVVSREGGPPDGVKIAVVTPCYNVGRPVVDLISRIGPEVCRIFVVDDGCPMRTGDLVEQYCSDERVVVLRHTENLGVGAAVVTGYKAGIAEGVDILVKLDGDGQMDPTLILDFVTPLIYKEADYAKGNRFFELEFVKSMPKVRLIGNAALSFMTKFATGYWNLFDPTNGFTAIHSAVAAHLPLDKVSKRFFFETDMLFRLNTIHAVVLDIPMVASYGNEVSNLRVSRVVGEFFWKNIATWFKRIFYNYYLRDLSLASFQLPIGFGMLCFGICYAIYHLYNAALTKTVSPPGIVMLAALPIIMGVQFLLAFVGYDIALVPTRPIVRTIRPSRLLSIASSAQKYRPAP